VKTFSKTPGAGEEFRPLDCPLCGGKSLKPHYSLPGAVYVRCRRCGLVFQCPQPEGAGVRQRYDEAYFEYEKANEEAFYRLARRGLDDLDFSRWGPEAGRLGPFLDIGCATGLLPARLSQEGYAVEGLEICLPAAEYARRRGGFPVHTRPLEEADLPRETYGIIHLSHVIEHVNDPAGLLRRLFDLLVPQGFLVITTPNLGGLQSLLFGKNWRSAIPDHLFLFTPATLKRTAARGGFRFVRSQTWGGLAEGLGPPWVKGILDPLVKTLNWGDVMILLFRKAS
jgi:SAM-dependent methyltransferase